MKTSRTFLFVSCTLTACLGLLLAAHAQASFAALAPQSGVPLATEQAARQGEHGSFALCLQSLGGLGVFTALAFGLGRQRKDKVRPDWRTLGATVGFGLLFVFVFAFLVLDTRPGEASFQLASDSIDALLGFAKQGMPFVFGSLARGNTVTVGIAVGGPADRIGPVAAPTGVADAGSYFAFNGRRHHFVVYAILRGRDFALTVGRKEEHTGELPGFAQRRSRAVLVLGLARMMGLEPTASALTGQRSNQLSYTRIRLRERVYP